MSNELPPLNDDPQFQAAATALSRLLNGDNPALAGDRLRRVMENAMQCADPEARPIIIGQINVLKVTHNWIARLAEDPDDGLRIDQAIREIQDAIFAGMRGERYV